MKILNLGKIVLLLLISLNLYADVSALADRTSVYRGEIVELTLSASGAAHFPKITDIGGYKILGTGDKSYTNIINGQMTKTVSRTYAFKPDANVTIPSFAIEVDGSIEHTASFDITVIPPQAGKNGDEFLLELNLNKNELMVGESAILSVTLKTKATTKVDDIKLQEPKIPNFWMESLGQGPKKIDGEYIKMSMNYLIFPQTSGEFDVLPISAAIGRVSGGNDPFFGSFFGNINYEQIYSNSLNIKVKPLPNGLSVYGDFKINASVDKNSTNAGEPVNLTIKINGVGNIDDITSFKLNDKNLLVYPSAPELKRGMINGEYGGEFTQKFAIVADKNFTIPEISFSYYDKLKKSVETITTKPFDIEVVGEKMHQNLEISTPNDKDEILQTKVSTKDSGFKIWALALAYILGLITFFILSKINFKSNKKDLDIKERIKRAKSDKVLFELLLPYAKKSKELDEILGKLEENLYKNGSNKIDKKTIIMEFFKLEL